MEGGEKLLSRVDRKEAKSPLAQGARDSCGSRSRALRGCKPISRPPEVTMKGGTECAPAINIAFYACCTFQTPPEDTGSSKCRLFKRPLIIRFHGG